ncbi:protein bassoon-like [Triticum aestivum]|uniref:protein bassoon-like n=1 Tax=Triticum aestivum TaxID=4565 RepID=UPI001D01B9B3|nr:protein bassoon-like [Triticum aestivum]
MGRSIAIWLLVAAAVILPLLVAVATHRLPRHAPGGGSGAWGRPEGLRHGARMPGVGAARRLGQRTPLKAPPSPDPDPGKGTSTRRLPTRLPSPPSIKE